VIAMDRLCTILRANVQNSQPGAGPSRIAGNQRETDAASVSCGFY
jgi:hypothetical protein